MRDGVPAGGLRAVAGGGGEGATAGRGRLLGVESGQLGEQENGESKKGV